MAYNLIIDTSKLASFKLPGTGAMWVERLEMTFDLPVNWPSERCLDYISNAIENIEVVPWRNRANTEQYVDAVKAALMTVADEVFDCGGGLSFTEEHDAGNIQVHFKEVE